MLLLHTLEDGQKQEARCPPVLEKAEASEAVGGMSGDTAALENNLAGPQTLTQVLCDPEMPLLGRHPRQMKRHVRAEMYTQSSQQHSHDGQRRNDPNLRFKGDDKTGSSHIMAQGSVIKRSI